MKRDKKGDKKDTPSGKRDPAGIRGPQNSGTVGLGTGSTGKGEAKPEPKNDDSKQEG